MRRALYGQGEFSCSFDLASDAYVRFVPLHRNSATAIALAAGSDCLCTLDKTDDVRTSRSLSDLGMAARLGYLLES
jgi:hypothetical protein